MNFQFRILEKQIDIVLQNTTITEKQRIQIISDTLKVFRELLFSIIASEHMLNTKFIPFIKSVEKEENTCSFKEINFEIVKKTFSELIKKLEKIKETYSDNSDNNQFHKSLNLNQFSTINPKDSKFNIKTCQIKTDKMIPGNSDLLKSMNFNSNFVNQRILPKSKTIDKHSQKSSNSNFNQTDEDEKIIINKLSYKFIRKISNGQFANVYQCQRKNSEKIAIKMIKKEILSNVHLKKYFDSEIKVLELCDHPNIIKLNEHFPNLGIYVLEYVDYSLKSFFFDNSKYNSFLQDGIIVYLISIQILKALDYIHSLNISHRDIKFENIMINTSTYEIKLIDFNVSKLIQGNENRATVIDNGICNSKSLIPLLIENSKEIDKIPIDSPDYFFYSDIYSFGVLLYFLSTRKINEKFDPIFCLYQNINILNLEFLKDIFLRYKQIKINDLINSTWANNYEKLIEKDIQRINYDHLTKNNFPHPNPYRDLLKERIETKDSENEFIFDDL